MAKTATYWQRGEALDYRNDTEEAIPAGTVLAVGKRHIGVAGTEIPAGGMGSVHVTGVFEFPKKSGTTLKLGDLVKFSDADGIDKDADGTASVGYAAGEAAAEDPTVLVKLEG